MPMHGKWAGARPTMLFFGCCHMQSLAVLRIGKNPKALDDLMKETASKMAVCPVMVAPPPVPAPLAFEQGSVLQR